MNPYLYTLVYYVVSAACIVVFLYVFELVTKYKDWEEIKKGNVSVALATGGKLLGICNIFRYSIEHNDSLGETLVWGVLGFFFLVLTYYIFEFLTRTIRVDEEIGKDNRAVGLLSAFLSIGFSYIVGASIT
ncbi:DUF350 domain-containing protein [Paenibacillus flagellatus]|uniref:DUF350 domain-containing protein n=1 Tax=Paenibacillus flagellatus TaxID=2211139 RepID=A0A2V5KAK7_9BACL|nr:DUF350 domain-containing protein [Paenibacillus flagellatus]PYI56488.1 DUF350 domain-containing protein [Paenibacillus flagellatus]